MNPAVRLAWAAAVLLCSACAPAAEIEGVKLPDRIEFDTDGSMLVLNGAGVRVRLIFKIYVAALYLPAKTSDGDAILRTEQPRRLLLHMLRDLSSDQINSSTNDALRETLTPEQRLPLESRMQRFNAIFETLREVKEGVRIVIDYVPALGTIVRVNGEERERIPGADFNQALLRMWIGDRPRDPELKKAMLGIPPN